MNESNKKSSAIFRNEAFEHYNYSSQKHVTVAKVLKKQEVNFILLIFACLMVGTVFLLNYKVKYSEKVEVICIDFQNQIFFGVRLEHGLIEGEIVMDTGETIISSRVTQMPEGVKDSLEGLETHTWVMAGAGLREGQFLHGEVYTMLIKRDISLWEKINT